MIEVSAVDERGGGGEQGYNFEEEQDEGTQEDRLQQPAA